jgi:hypothetical protein
MPAVQHIMVYMCNIEAVLQIDLKDTYLAWLMPLYIINETMRHRRVAASRGAFPLVKL